LYNRIAKKDDALQREEVIGGSSNASTCCRTGGTKGGAKSSTGESSPIIFWAFSPELTEGSGNVVGVHAPFRRVMGGIHGLNVPSMWMDLDI
jgi:hypothetical protein